MTTISDGFKRDLAALINRYSLENRSDTPDYILAEHMCNALIQFEQTTNERERWYGRDKSALPDQPTPVAP